jgi:hypothetical protein
MSLKTELNSTFTFNAVVVFRAKVGEGSSFGLSCSFEFPLQKSLPEWLFVNNRCWIMIQEHGKSEGGNFDG